MKDFGLVINGSIVLGAGTLEVINPATEQVFSHCGRADRSQVDAAVAAALTAFPGWERRGIDDRRRHLLAIADGLEERLDEFVQLLTAEQGKPLEAAAGELKGGIGMLRALAMMNLESRLIREDDNTQVFEHRTPLGVVAAITPWNFPFFILMAKFAPALLAGNTMVAKPAPTTPLTTLLLGQLCMELLPPGVFNVVVDDNDLGDYLTSHPDVAKISFTGSTATGKKVLASSAASLKRITLELGGNDPAIVLPDVHATSAAPGIFAAAMANSGQVCIAIKRVYVHSSAYDAFCDALAAHARNTVVGDGAMAGTQLGPLHNKAQYDKVCGLIERAREDGNIIAGGVFPTRPGYFILPTIVRDIPDDAQLVREEQFGPVLPILAYDSIDDAIERANDSEFALGASVWSNDLEQARRVAVRLTAGTVWINTHLDLQPDLPFRGARQSGMGAELGRAGLEEFTQAHVVHVAKRLVGAV